MKNFKFKSYDSGDSRAYFTNNRRLYCLQPGVFGVDLLTCSKDGEPDYQVKTQDDFSFEGFDAVRWMFSDVREYFEDAKDLAEQCNRMDLIFRNNP